MSAFGILTDPGHLIYVKVVCVQELYLPTQKGIIVPQISANFTEYRGYTLSLVERAPGWQIKIFPGPQLLHTEPDHVSGSTKEEALAKARAIIDHHLSK